SSLSMISICSPVWGQTARLSALHGRCERNQCDVSGLLDGFSQAALMRRADAGNTAWDNLAALGNKRVEQAGVFIVNIVDLLDTEPAHFLTPEILLLSGDRFVAASGPLA